jgi:phosphoribosylaminoimidazole-succinocarboxamide synthase
VLTDISLFWFHKLRDIIPNHVVTANVDEMPEEVRKHTAQLEGRTMLVRKAKVVPLEAIVRGYITGMLSFTIELERKRSSACCGSGSGWSEYKKSGTVHGIKLPGGLVESQKLPEPLFTPSTKAEQGAHDENISPERGTAYLTMNLTTC